MIQLIVTIVFLSSFLGIVFILYRKIPSLMRLSQTGDTGLKNSSIISSINDRFKNFFSELNTKIWLHKLLSLVKVLTLKVEVIIDNLLHNIRSKASRIDKDIKKK